MLLFTNTLSTAGAVVTVIEISSMYVAGALQIGPQQHAEHGSIMPSGIIAAPIINGRQLRI
jgi:hypothetical protein